MGPRRSIASAPRVSILAAALGAALAPAGARGDARPADRLTTTAGSTTLLRPLRGSGAIRSSHVSIDLYGDHATITQDVAAAAAGEEYEILAPLSPPDQSPWPGHVVAGDFPSFVALSPAAQPLDVVKGLDTAPVGRLVGQVVDDAWTFVVDRSVTAVRRLVVSARKDAQVRVVWTVPYLGDTYHGIRPLDCTCGDPWNFDLHLIGLVVDPAGGARSELSIWNHTGVAAVLRQAGKDDGGGGKWEVRLKPGGADRGVIDDWPGDKPPGWTALRRAVPFSITFADERSTPTSDYPRTPLSITCGSPQEDEGGLDDYDPVADARREKRLARDRAAFRWEAVCRLGDKTSARRAAPKFLKLDGADSSWPRKDWFIRGFAREVLGATWGVTWWPRGLGAWPIAQAGMIRSLADRVVVQASSTLPSKGDLYRAANLLDGNPMSAWCEGDRSDGRGSRVQLAFPEPATITGLAILPGYVKADWLYEANAAPRRVRVIVETGSGKRESVHDLALPGSAELFAEGRSALVLPVDAADVVMLTLIVDQVRPGKFTRDLCISELIPMPR